MCKLLSSAVNALAQDVIDLEGLIPRLNELLRWQKLATSETL